MANFVQRYNSTDLNAPPLQGIVNSAIRGPLNACLVDGYGDNGIAITSLTKSGTTATATCSADDMLRLQTGNILTISGATGAGGDAALYNITATITWASSTTFTYTMGGTPSGNATGSPVWSKRLPCTTITKSGTVALVTMTNVNGTLINGNYVTIAGCTGGDASTYNITAQIQAGNVPWLATTAYVLGNLVTNNALYYVCRVAGTSAGSGGPTGTGTGITDGGVTWDYVGATVGAYFTYIMGGTPGSNAAGSPVYYKAGLQWTRPYTNGTNSQTYRSPDATSPQHYLQVIDNAAQGGAGKEAQIYGAEVMSADNTVSSGRFPTTAQLTNGLCFRKSSTADTTQRPWLLWGDDRTFFLHSTSTGDGGSAYCQPMGFGYFISTKAGDGFNTFIIGNSTFNASNSANAWGGYSSGYGLIGSVLYIARLYSQAGTSVQGGFLIPGVGTFLTYPNPADSGVYFEQILVTDIAGNIRGRMPGLYYPLHGGVFNEQDQFSNITGLTGVTLTIVRPSSSSTFQSGAFDTFGPWT